MSGASGGSGGSGGSGASGGSGVSGGLPDGTCMRVTAGSPTADEIAALVAALDAWPASPAKDTPRPAADVQTPAWARAARREAFGDAPVATPADLRRPILRR